LVFTARSTSVQVLAEKLGQSHLSQNIRATHSPAPRRRIGQSAGCAARAALRPPPPRRPVKPAHLPETTTGLPQAAHTPKSPRNPLSRATHSPPTALAIAHRSARCLPVRAVLRPPHHGAVHRLAPKHEVAPYLRPTRSSLCKHAPSYAELTAVCHGSRHRGTHVSGRSHRRLTHSEPSLAPNRAATTSNRTYLPHSSPGLWPQRMPPPGAAACSAAAPTAPSFDLNRA
jgi:hypothetical protein